MHGIIQRSHATSVIRYMYLIFLIDIHMGRFLSLMLAMCALFFEGFAQRQVQGIARPDLNTGKTNFRSGELRSDTRFSFEDIQFWVAPVPTGPRWLSNGMTELNLMPWSGGINGMERLPA